MDKERVRAWLRQRSRERAPLPSMEQIRQELGWCRRHQPALLQEQQTVPPRRGQKR